MITKALQARIICDYDTRKKLWRLTENFNDSVLKVLKKMLAMRGGKAGPELKAVFDAITSSHNAIAKMEAIGKEKWNTKKLSSPDAESFRQIRCNLDDAYRRIGGWIDTHPMEWRDHFINDLSLLRWRRDDVGFADFSKDDIQQIEKKKRVVTGRRKPSMIQAGKKQADWKAYAARLLKKNNEELNALDRTRRELDWAEKAQAARKDPNRFFDQERDLPNLSSEFRRKTYEAAFAIIDSYNEKLKDWKKRHAQWLQEKRKFEKENKPYMAVRHKFDEFERRVSGIGGKRRRRWHHYLEFLKVNPELAAWRGGPHDVNPIPKDGLERIKRARRNKHSTVEAYEFFRVNPELKALDEMHGRYEEEFVRRDSARRFLDGFSLPPTLTLPHLHLHPCWYTFKREASYSNLNWTRRRKGVEGTVEITLPFKVDANRYDKLKLSFRGTPRLGALRNAAKSEIVVDGKGRSTTTFTKRYMDPHSPKDPGRPAEIKGIKLMFRPAKPTGTPYLVFTVALADKALSQRAQHFLSSKKMTEGMISCTADLIMRHPHLAAVSIAVAEKNSEGRLVPRIVRTGFIKAAEIESAGRHKGRVSRGPSLKHQAMHKQHLQKLRRGSRAVKGNARNRQFQEHVTNMGEDACRKAARKLINFATKAWAGGPADILSLENLKALRADARRERGLNAALINWRRGHTAKWTKEFAIAEGLLFREEGAYWTSQMCSRCLRLGRRYTPRRNKETGTIEPCFGPVESLFACPTEGCQIDVNADLNASVNLQHVLYGNFPKIAKQGDTIHIGRSQTTYCETEANVLKRLNAKRDG